MGKNDINQSISKYYIDFRFELRLYRYKHWNVGNLSICGSICSLLLDGWVGGWMDGWMDGWID